MIRKLWKIQHPVQKFFFVVLTVLIMLCAINILLIEVDMMHNSTTEIMLDAIGVYVVLDAIIMLSMYGTVRYYVHPDEH